MCKRWLWLWPSDPPREKTRAKAYAERVISNLKPNLPVYTHPTEGQVCKEHLVNRRRDGTVCESLCQCSVYLRGFKLNDVIFLEIWDVVSIWGQELEVYVVVVFFWKSTEEARWEKKRRETPVSGDSPRLMGGMLTSTAGLWHVILRKPMRDMLWRASAPYAEMAWLWFDACCHE
jgi:hypothetical protein